MQDDIAALKKGQTPAPVSLPARPPMPPPTTLPPSVPFRPPLAPQVNLGGMEKARTMPAAPLPHPIAPVPVATGPTTAINIPPVKNSGHFSKTGLFIVLVILLIGGAVLWYFLYYQPNQVAKVLPTATFSPTPRPTPVIEGVFSTVQSVTAPLVPDYFPGLHNTINALALVTNDPALYSAFAPLASSSAVERVRFSRFTSITISNIPMAVSDAAMDNQFYVTVMRKTENQLGDGFIAKLKPGSDVSTALRTWEAILPTDLQKLFHLDAKKAAGKTFSDNTYQGVPVRYRNFPDASMTIDYAIVTASDGSQYLIFTNSRQHIYAIIDRLSGGVGSPTPSN